MGSSDLEAGGVVVPLVTATPSSVAMGSQEDDDSLDQASLIANLMNPQTQLPPGPASSTPQSPINSSGAVEMSLRPILDDSMGDEESLLGPRGALVHLGNEDSQPGDSHNAPGHPPQTPHAASTPLPTLNRGTHTTAGDAHHSEDGLGLGTDVTPSDQHHKGTDALVDPADDSESSKEKSPQPPTSSGRQSPASGPSPGPLSIATSIPQKATTTGGIVAPIDQSPSSTSSPSLNPPATPDTNSPQAPPVQNPTLRIARSASGKKQQNPRLRPLGRQRDTAPPEDRNRPTPEDETTTGADTSTTSSQQRAKSQPPVQRDLQMRSNLPPPTTPARTPGHSRHPSGSSARSARRGRPATTPTTALRPRPSTTSQSEDSFVRLTAAEERERWLRSDDAQGLSIPIQRLQGASSSGPFETETERHLGVGGSLRPPSPRRHTSPRRPASPPKRSTPAKTDPPFTTATRGGQDTAFPAPQPPVPQTSPRARHAFQDRNSSMAPASRNVRPSTLKGKEKQVVSSVEEEEEQLSSQMSQMSVEGASAIMAAPAIGSDSVIIRATPSDTSGSSNRSKFFRDSIGFDFNAKVPSVPSTESQKSSNPSNPGQPQSGLSHVAGEGPGVPSPLTYESSSETRRRLNAAAALPPPSTPPQDPHRGPVFGVPMDVTPTQPGEVLDSQHPLAQLARERFTVQDPQGVSIEGSDNIPGSAVDVPMVSRRLDFGESASGNESGSGEQAKSSSVPEPTTTSPQRKPISTPTRNPNVTPLAPPPRIERSAQPQMAAKLPIFPPVRALRPRLGVPEPPRFPTGPSTGLRPRIGRREHEDVIAATPQPPSDPGLAGPRSSSPTRPRAGILPARGQPRPGSSASSPERPLAAVVAGATNAPRISRPVYPPNPPLRPFQQVPVGPPNTRKRTFQQMQAPANPATEQEPQIPSRTDRVATPGQEGPSDEPSFSPNTRRRLGKEVTPARQYHSKSKLERDDGKKRRRITIDVPPPQDEDEEMQDVAGRGPMSSPTLGRPLPRSSPRRTPAPVPQTRLAVPDTVAEEAETSQETLDMDVDSPQTPPPPPRPSSRGSSTRGRSSSRRRGSSSTRGRVTRSSSRTRAGSTRPVTPGSTSSTRRSAKKQRTSLGPTSRVFARWTDRSFYPGRVTAQNTRNRARFTVLFDDGDSMEVDVSKMRRGDLRVGDMLIVNGKARQIAKVTDITGWGVAGKWSVDVVINHRNGSQEEATIESKNLRVSEKEVERQWVDRRLEIDDVELAEINSFSTNTGTNSNEASLATPAPKPPTNAPPSARRVHYDLPGSAQRQQGGRAGTRGPERSGLFTGIVFVITHHPESGVTDARKDRLKKDIERYGGYVANNWDEVYSIEGHGNISGRKDIRWVLNKPGITNVLLLADKATQTVKYLMALALGVPCVSTQWITDCLGGFEHTWQQYLLAAGRSDHLSAEVSQLYDSNWSIDLQLLHNPFRSRAIRRPWHELKVLCILLSPRGRGSDPNVPSRYVQMMCALGAASVELVADHKKASRQLSTYDHIVVNDEKVASFKKDAAGHALPPIGTISWFKQCLIGGHLLPLNT